jgi:hypothetical protein
MFHVYSSHVLKQKEYRIGYHSFSWLSLAELEAACQDVVRSVVLIASDFDIYAEDEADFDLAGCDVSHLMCAQATTVMSRDEYELKKTQNQLPVDETPLVRVWFLDSHPLRNLVQPMERTRRELSGVRVLSAEDVRLVFGFGS